jgi:hypothetical protein
MVLLVEISNCNEINKTFVGWNMIIRVVMHLLKCDATYTMTARCPRQAIFKREGQYKIAVFQGQIRRRI